LLRIELIIYQKKSGQPKTVYQFLIHGTGMNRDYFKNQNPSFTPGLAAAYQANGYRVVQSNFDWSNKAGINNQPEDRTEAAGRLSRHIFRTLEDQQNKGTMPKEIRVSLVGHSHGGNVAIQVLKDMEDIARRLNVKITVDLVTLNTPVYQNDQTGPTRNGYNIEDPRGYAAGLGDQVTLNHLHVGVKGDTVTLAAAGDRSNNYVGNTANKTYADPTGGWGNSIRDSFRGLNLNFSNGFKQHYAVIADPKLANDFTGNVLKTFVQKRPMQTQPQRQASVGI
jgi:pimeloyl-ACP methyl ester carboxylesterase